MTNIGSLKRGPENDASIFCRFSDRKSLSPSSRISGSAAAMIERAPNTLSDEDLFSFSLSLLPCPPNLYLARALSLSTQHVIEKRKIDVFNGNADAELCAAPLASSAGHCSISNNDLEMPRIMTKFTMRSPAAKREIHARGY